MGEESSLRRRDKKWLLVMMIGKPQAVPRSWDQNFSKAPTAFFAPGGWEGKGGWGVIRSGC